MNARRQILLLGMLVTVTAGICIAQFRPGGRGGSFTRIEGGLVVDEDTIRTARETASHSMDTPVWTNASGLGEDVFTFARIIFQSNPNAGTGWGRGRRLGWWVDYPDADLNFSYRLQHLTSIRTDPNCRVLKLTDPALRDYPLIYLEHAGYMTLSDTETDALRKYLASGGAMFVNDFWGQQEWDGFASAIDQIKPGCKWVELTMDHPLFHCVFDLKGPMNRLQVPTIQFWNPDHDPANPESHLQRVYRGEGYETMHVRAAYDEKQRIQILAILNSDISDGWEREGENNDYFHTYSEKIAYPMGINIIFYMMTH